MTSASLELQGAIVARLKSVSGVTALIGQRTYDAAPDPVTFPYVSLGPSDELSDNAECKQADEVTMQIDVWSRATGFPEVRRIAAAVRAALHEFEASLTDNAFVLIEHRQTRFLRDPDGLTSRAAMEFRAIIEIPTSP